MSGRAEVRECCTISNWHGNCLNYAGKAYLVHMLEVIISHRPPTKQTTLFPLTEDIGFHKGEEVLCLVDPGRSERLRASLDSCLGQHQRVT